MKSGPAHTARLIYGAGAAVDVSSLRSAGHGMLASRADVAGESLARRGLTGIRARCVLMLDHSGSMGHYYRSGAVQELVERALGFALQLDADGKIPVIPWDSRLRDGAVVGVANYRGVVGSGGRRGLWQPRDMQGTALDLALARIRSQASVSDLPLFAMVVTDGEPDSQSKAASACAETARYPVFLKFLALGRVRFLDQLERGQPGRLVPNVRVTTFPTLAMSDAQFAEAMADGWETWVAAATTAGILRADAAR
ncbi:VWA domain-containing protein [Pseudofrankia asymbiotica]|nr:VWA domain-containing protein [Pseudofrankia asymbiotica]